MFKQMAVAAAIGFGAVAASATTITFDDLSDTGMGTLIANGYNGFDWDNFFVLNTPAFDTPDTGYQHGVVSGENVAYNGYGAPASFSRATEFTFNSVFLTKAWYDYGTFTVRFEGFNGVNSVYLMNVVVNTVAPTLATFNWTGITKVVMTTFSGNGSQAVLDNLVFDGAVSAVPLPAAALLFGSGLLGMAGLGRKKRVSKEPAEALA